MKRRVPAINPGWDRVAVMFSGSLWTLCAGRAGARVRRDESEQEEQEPVRNHTPEDRRAGEAVRGDENGEGDGTGLAVPSPVTFRASGRVRRRRNEEQGRLTDQHHGEDGHPSGGEHRPNCSRTPRRSATRRRRFRR